MCSHECGHAPNYTSFPLNEGERPCNKVAHTYKGKGEEMSDQAFTLR